MVFSDSGMGFSEKEIEGLCTVSCEAEAVNVGTDSVAPDILEDDVCEAAAGVTTGVLCCSGGLRLTSVRLRRSSTLRGGRGASFKLLGLLLSAVVVSEG